MFASVVRSAGQVSHLSPAKVEEFENMMKNTVKQSKLDEIARLTNKEKRVITYDPKKSPFAPLYRPDKEVLYKLDKYHIEPPKNFYKKSEIKSKEYAVAAPPVPPIPPEDNPSNMKDMKKLEKYLSSENAEMFKNNKIDKLDYSKIYK